MQERMQLNLLGEKIAKICLTFIIHSVFFTKKIFLRKGNFPVNLLIYFGNKIVYWPVKEIAIACSVQ